MIKFLQVCLGLITNETSSLRKRALTFLTPVKSAVLDLGRVFDILPICFMIHLGLLLKLPSSANQTQKITSWASVQQPNFTKWSPGPYPIFVEGEKIQHSNPNWLARTGPNLIDISLQLKISIRATCCPFLGRPAVEQRYSVLGSECREIYKSPKHKFMGRKAGTLYINPKKFGNIAKPCMKEMITFLNCLSVNQMSGEKCVRNKELLSVCMDAQTNKKRKPWGSINYHLQRLNRGRK